MKILLDIDGVMIPARPWQTYKIEPDGFGMFSNHSVKALNSIISASQNPEIILTTSHKHSFDINSWSSIFNNRGIIKTRLSRLSSDSSQMTRFEEIQKWYYKNLNESFIILDDDKGLNQFDDNFKQEHLILLDGSVGLNRLKAEDAINKINLIHRLV